MRWALLSLWLLAAALYAAGAFTPTREERPAPAESAALVSPDDAQRARLSPRIHAIDPSAPSVQEAVPNGTLQEQLAASQTSETPTTLSNDLAASDAVLPSDNPGRGNHSWGQLLRDAPVHSGPSVSSPILGYAAANTEMQLLERNLGWVRILDPATSREGWIYEDHVTPKEGPGASRQEAALESDADLGELEQPKRSFKTKKSRKNYAKKRWRKPLRFVFRFRRF